MVGGGYFGTGIFFNPPSFFPNFLLFCFLLISNIFQFVYTINKVRLISYYHGVTDYIVYRKMRKSLKLIENNEITDFGKKWKVKKMFCPPSTYVIFVFFCLIYIHVYTIISTYYMTAVDSKLVIDSR